MGIDVEQCYHRFGSMVIRRCQQLLGDEQAAVDAAQDVFLELVRHQSRLEDRGLSSLLWRTATNTCLNRLRSRRRRPEDADGDVITRIALAPEAEERVLAGLVLERLFGREPASTRTMAVMLLVDRMTLEEVAELHGLSVSGVRHRIRVLKQRIPELEGL
ncbi:MAG: sigma-70 family RNA polymerase sigma factor [Alphaproteobacteria bacterium]|nr:sigma-70 family RNA polymerase sigma factor [Alphaproteobacteria bacterium]MCB9699396.1 sigma-70 family RNA polymerase sigma factor [Alphaproteobacteria bacterium]